MVWNVYGSKIQENSWIKKESCKIVHNIIFTGEKTTHPNISTTQQIMLCNNSLE